MRNSYIRFIIGVFCLSGFNSCEIYNPAEPIPAYIHIDKITVVKNPAGFSNSTYPDEGSLSSKISDAWVYIDEQLIGCFELPTSIPVLYSGSHQVKIRAGIKVNGIAATRSPYPFYQEYTQNINFIKGGKTYLSPTVMYRSNTTFKYMENFENPGTILRRSGASGVDTSIQRLFSPNPNVFPDGTGSGIAYLTPQRTYFECVLESTPLPQGSAPVFLEFNYKCNHEFVTGVYGLSNSSTLQVEALTFNPSASWNKAYLYLSPAIGQSGNSTQFSVFIGMRNFNSEDSLALVLDNIKLVY